MKSTSTWMEGVIEYNLQTFEDPISGIIRIFFLVFLIMFAGVSLNSGFFHLLVIVICGILFDVFGIRPVSFMTFRDMGVACVVAILFRYIVIYFDRREFRLPVYLCFTKQQQSCEYHPYLGLLPFLKHWCVITDLNPEETDVEKRFYNVSHATGTILRDMKSTHNVWSYYRITRVCYGFYRMGLTCEENVKKLRMRKIDEPYSCQQYSHFVTQFLCVPASNADYLHGRILYYVSFLCTMALFLHNQFLSHYTHLLLPIDVVFGVFLLFDLYSCFRHAPSEKLKKKTYHCSFVTFCCVFTFVVLQLFIKDEYKFGQVGGHATLAFFSLDLVSNFVILPILVPSFFRHEKKKKKLKK